MKISEKQIYTLIIYLTQLSDCSGNSLTNSGIEEVRNLLNDIANQQSVELKEVQ